MTEEERMEMIVRTASRLGPESRATLAERILGQEGRAYEGTAHRYAVLLQAAEQAVGCTMDRSRKAESVMIRRFVAYRMRQDGAFVTDIADAMGVDHSTVTHYVRQMKDCFAFPVFYSRDLELYMTFNDIVENEQVRES